MRTERLWRRPEDPGVQCRAPPDLRAAGCHARSTRRRLRGSVALQRGARRLRYRRRRGQDPGFPRKGACPVGAALRARATRRHDARNPQRSDACGRLDLHAHRHQRAPQGRGRGAACRSDAARRDRRHRRGLRALRRRRSPRVLQRQVPRPLRRRGVADRPGRLVRTGRAQRHGPGHVCHPPGRRGFVGRRAPGGVPRGR